MRREEMAKPIRAAPRRFRVAGSGAAAAAPATRAAGGIVAAAAQPLNRARPQQPRVPGGNIEADTAIGDVKEARRYPGGLVLVGRKLGELAVAEQNGVVEALRRQVAIYPNEAVFGLSMAA
jgi:hypothetical protein